MDEAAKKAILRHFPYGLYVVTVAHDGEDHGMTANWVASGVRSADGRGRHREYLQDNRHDPRFPPLRDQPFADRAARSRRQIGAQLRSGAAETQGNQDETGPGIRRSGPGGRLGMG